MPDYADIQSIRNFKSLVKYLRKHLDWPVDEEQADDLTFDYTPAELGLDEVAAVKVREIKQIRPLAAGQPWGIFWIDFEPKRLPVVVMRRILAALVRSKRGAGAKKARQAAWDLRDLMFISATGEGNRRGISFAHFRETGDGQPQLRAFSWDADERHFYYLKTENLDALCWPDDPSDIDGWRERWAAAFTTGYRETIETAKDLASNMADLAAATRELANEVYQYEKASGPLHKLYDAFRRVLIHDLSMDDFADMYAQTVTYGLFSARATRTGRFALENVPALIPNTNPFLRKLFDECLKVGTVRKNQIDLDELGVGELMEALRSADMEAVLRDFGRQSRDRKEDPVIHFYESFLREYDAEKKARRGVFYTPDPVVSFIVRSVDYLLRTEFDCPDGLADTGTMKWKGQTVPKAQILDPATGTGTFLKYVIEQIYETFTRKHAGLGPKGIQAKWNEYVPRHLLPRLYGFELMMAPYAVAHMKLGLALQETGYNFESDERLRVYLTNALQPAHEVPRVDAPFLAQEAYEANIVKTKTPITVVIGNPPYSNFGMMNKGDWILNLLSDYKKGLNEKKLNLDDDFIKFMRFAQWRIEQTGQGILALITNNTYLDGITHHRMRQSLLKTFDDVYILDLHGSSKKKETAPDGSKDENVFDIQQGVSISIFVKRKTTHGAGRVFHADLRGPRHIKYESLSKTDVASVKWHMISPVEPHFFLVDRDLSKQPEYKATWSVASIFTIYGNGIGTDRDSLFYDFDRLTLEGRIREFYDRRRSAEFDEIYNVKASSSYDIVARRSSTRFNREYLTLALYRPFDERWLYYNPDLTSRPAYDVMRHLREPNWALLVTRQVSTGVFRHVFATNKIIDRDPLSLATRERTQSFPIYIYAVENVSWQYNIWATSGTTPSRCSPNLNPEFIADVETHLGLKFAPDGTGDLNKTFGPEDIFHYMYAVFYSPTYRERYAEFLKIDFPRLSLTRNLNLFRALAAKGKELVGLHLMESPALDKPITKFVGRGDNVVASGYPTYEKRTVWINDEQGFEGVPEDVWEFHIGGYQVCRKWLKDRRERKLSQDDLVHYQKIVVALKETIRLMAEIDEAIPGWPIK